MSAPQIIADGVVASIRFTLCDPEGTVLDKTDEDEVMHYLHGAENLVPGLERELGGKGPGDQVRKVVPPALGYGERIEGQTEEVPRSAFPAEAELEVGMLITGEDPDGEETDFWVLEADEERVVLDTNHPLAGRTLHFEVEVVELRAATELELELGFAGATDSPSCSCC